MVDPISIEHIFELRDWIETIPLVVKGLDEMMRVYMIVSNYSSLIINIQ